MAEPYAFPLRTSASSAVERQLTVVAPDQSPGGQGFRFSVAGWKSAFISVHLRLEENLDSCLRRNDRVSDPFLGQPRERYFFPAMLPGDAVSGAISWL